MLKKGFTLVELLVSFGLIAVVSSVILVNFRPVENRAKARDVVRLSDMGILMGAVEEYYIDHSHQFPGTKNVTYRSDLTPQGGACYPNCANLVSGWLDPVYDGYLEKLPIDPKNEGELIYRYRHDGSRYKADCFFEYANHRSLMETDGGNNPNRYEKGTGSDTISF